MRRRNATPLAPTGGTNEEEEIFFLKQCGVPCYYGNLVAAVNGTDKH